MRMLDLFSGIGGFSLAAQWCWGNELEIVSFVEIDPFCQKVLKKHWPNVPIIGDVRDVKIATHGENIGQQLSSINGWNQEGENTSEYWELDLLTGGFPCQPFSVAGKRKGKEDDRFIWPQMLRVIKEFRPRWIIAENVAGIVSVALDDCLSDLEAEGYTARPVIIPACAVNAPHRRDRVWIVGFLDNSSSSRHLEQSRQTQTFTDSNGEKNGLSEQTGEDVAYQYNKRFSPFWKQGRVREEKGQARSGIERTGMLRRERDSGWWNSEPDVGRVANGIPSRVDRLKSLGNAIVPQVAYQIMRAIKEVDKGHMEEK